jgi:hypothetical protein
MPMTPQAFKLVYDAHREHWSARTDELKNDLNLYRNGGEGTPVPVAFQMVEALVGSLFLRAPSVIGAPGVYGEGSPELAAACANEILRKSNASIENAVKSALVFPGAYLVVVPVKARNPMDRVRVLPAHAWRVIRDADALDWGSAATSACSPRSRLTKPSKTTAGPASATGCRTRRPRLGTWSAMGFPRPMRSTSLWSMCGFPWKASKSSGRPTSTATAGSTRGKRSRSADAWKTRQSRMRPRWSASTGCSTRPAVAPGPGHPAELQP